MEEICTFSEHLALALGYVHVDKLLNLLYHISLLLFSQEMATFVYIIL